MKRFRLPSEQQLGALIAGGLLLLVLALGFLLPLPPNARLALVAAVALGATLTGFAARAPLVALRRRFPLAAVAALGLAFAYVFILHPYLPAVDVLFFAVVAGAGAAGGPRAGLSLALAAAASHIVVVAVFEPFSATALFAAIVFDLHLFLIGALAGGLSAQRPPLDLDADQAWDWPDDSLDDEGADYPRGYELKTEMYEMITHDLKSPLGTIISALQLIHENLPPDAPRLRQPLATALKASQRQMTLIENMLDLQRLRAGALPLSLEPLELGPLLQWLVEQFEPRLERKGIRVEARLAQDLPPVLADRQIISRVIANLLDNAYKFTPSQGQITVEVRRAAGHLSVVVADTGPGIPDPERNSIFEKYRQVIAGTAGARDGAGLGLAFCRMALQAHGGEIAALASPSGGAQFEFTLPLAEAS